MKRPLFPILYTAVALLCIPELPAQPAPGTGVRAQIEKELEVRGLAYEERPLFRDYGGFGTSVHVDIEAAAGSSAIGSFAIVAPSNSSRLTRDTLLELAQRASREHLPRPLRIAFLADEASALCEDLRGPSFLGLRDLCDRYEDREQVSVLYLDLPEQIEAIELFHGSLGTVAPLGLIRPFTATFRSQKIPLYVSLPYNELFRLNLIDGPEQLRVLQAQGFPALYLGGGTSFQQGQKTPVPQLTAVHIADALYAGLSSYNTESFEQDRHYTLLSFGKWLFPLSEWVSVSLFILVVGLGILGLLIYSLTHRPLLVARGAIFLRRSWVILFFTAVFALCFRSGGLCLSIIQLITRAPRFQNDWGFAVLKMAIAVCLYILASHYIRFRRLPKRSHFYSNAASAMLALGALFSAALDFTYVPVILWALLISLAASLVRSRTLAFVTALLAPLPILIAILAAAGSGESRPSQAILFGGPLVELYFAFMIQPFLFLYRRAFTLPPGRSRPPKNRTHQLATRTILLGGLLATSVFYASQRAREVRAEPPIVRVYRDEMTDDLTLTMKRSSFLDRQSISVSVQAIGQPRRIRLWFEGESPLLIYDAPMPLVWSEDQKHCECVLGEYPPGSIQADFTLPRSFSGSLHAEAIYAQGDCRWARILLAKEEITVPHE